MRAIADVDAHELLTQFGDGLLGVDQQLRARAKGGALARVAPSVATTSDASSGQPARSAGSARSRPRVRHRTAPTRPHPCLPAGTRRCNQRPRRAHPSPPGARMGAMLLQSCTKSRSSTAAVAHAETICSSPRRVPFSGRAARGSTRATLPSFVRFTSPTVSPRRASASSSPGLTPRCPRSCSWPSTRRSPNSRAMTAAACWS